MYIDRHADTYTHRDTVTYVSITIYMQEENPEGTSRLEKMKIQAVLFQAITNDIAVFSVLFCIFINIFNEYYCYNQIEKTIFKQLKREINYDTLLDEINNMKHFQRNAMTR